MAIEFVRWLAKNNKITLQEQWMLETLAIDFEKEHPVWKEVSEKPENDRWVLICTKDGWIEKTYYNPDTKGWTNYDGDVTHWRELPEGPKQ